MKIVRRRAVRREARAAATFNRESLEHAAAALSSTASGAETSANEVADQHLIGAKSDAAREIDVGAAALVC